MRAFVMMVSCILVIGSAEASVFRVERDGSGDYLVIQDAVDAAASGDTVLIGPGRFDEGQMVTTPGWTEFVRVLVTQEELTLIGAGAGQTIIGRTEPWSSAAHGKDKGIEGGQWWGVQRLVVEDISFENTAHGITAEPAPELIVRNCNFSGNKYSIISYNGRSVTVENCSFRNPAEHGDMLYSSANESTSVVGCQFEIETGVGTPLHIQNNWLVNVQNCVANGGGTGGTFSGNLVLTVADCAFADQLGGGINLRGNRNAIIESCELARQKIAINVTGNSSQTTIRNMVITDVSHVSVAYAVTESFRMENSILAHGPQYTVLQYGYKAADKELYYMDMRNNDWGTTDADTIASWISVSEGTVDFIPYIGMPVATEEKSWGSVKSMFR